MTKIKDDFTPVVVEDYYPKVTERLLNRVLKIKPKKGLSLVWPADWTFTHRGNSAPSEEKYIVTGWFNYLE